MDDYKRVPTTPEVWAVIHASHPELCVFSSYSAPEGNQFGDPNRAVMFTSYGFSDADYPLIEAQSSWDVPVKDYRNKSNEKHEYWLCLPIKENEE